MNSKTNVACAAHADKQSIDWLLWVSATATALGYVLHWQFAETISNVHWLHELSHSAFELVDTIWWGVLIGIVMIAILARIPREFVMSALGTQLGFRGIMRATVAGVLLDLCSHGVLMVGAKLYERGASTGQVIAFLVSSPWNSLSLTLILIALIGLPWTAAFIVLSMLIAVTTGVAFDWCTRNGVLPENPRKNELPDDFKFWPEASKRFNGVRLTPHYIVEMLIEGVKESRMVMRWILSGVLLASIVRAFVSPELFQEYFGPTLLGLSITIVLATVLEVCSEGSTPIAADILTRAGAPGNSFAFLMGGVATDYTEIMIIRDTTSSWKVALFLPLITLPQIILLAWMINQLSLG